MKSFSWTLALRYLNPLRNFVSVITLISLLGVAFGVMVLIVVLTVHNGFERQLKETLLGHSPHLAVYSRYGNIENWSEQEDALAGEAEVESAYALVEGFALLDSKKWQRPVFFRAFNTENQGQTQALEALLDPDFPGSSVDFNPPIGDAMAAPPPASLEGDEGRDTRLAPIEEGEIYGNRLAVISSQLADAIEVGPGDEIRVVSASNFDQLMEVYNYPSERAWELYPDVFEGFAAGLKTVLEEGDSGEERAELTRLRTTADPLAALVPPEVATPDGLVAGEGAPMRAVERKMVSDILEILDQPLRAGDDGYVFYEAGTRGVIEERLEELRTLDLEEADNQQFREIEEFVIPKTLKIQGVYRVSERSQGPDLFIPIEIGMELKGVKAAEFIGLRVGDPYRAGMAEARVQEGLGPDWVVQSWMRRHADRFQLVKTEKIMMSFALSFITLLSAFSIMAVMYTVTVQKRQEIGVMKALGARPTQIVRVFLYQGLVVGVGGALLGLGLGLLAIRYREGVMAVIRGFGVDPFPAEFHGMSELPAHLVGPQLVIIAVVAVVLCLLAALVPALMAAFRDPAKSLRNL